MSVHKSIRVVADNGAIDVDPQHLSKNKHEQARWFSHTGKRSIIYFNKPEGSPFQEKEFHVPAGGDVSSGPLRAGLKDGEKFHYTVVGPAGTNDPVIIIDN